MSDNHSEEQHIGIPGYLVIFGILFVGTIITYYVALTDLDSIFVGANTLVALGIAFFKMSCVMLYFMHVRYSGHVVKLLAASGFVWLALMSLITMSDIMTRGWIG